ncbi:BON domain-containing protein [Vibrio ziniensis]|uniref:BON domain-containing protein n=1 Tax=Vibrio ziniensis TaxID=2711221 RepID=A0A6G7CKP0_9VIBR|nr:BON domain-containing protein [Vibrio ziniensis]QIH42669.1 BON domain-containing protein [Vibrio ziniensis]
MKFLSLSLILSIVLSLSGCAGLFIAGVATTANLVTDPRTTQQIWDDNQIEFEIAGLGNKEPYVGAARFVASSYQGTVVLMGQARNAELLDKFIAQTNNVKGVKELHNQVKIAEPSTVRDISNDSWITSKVKSALLIEPSLNGTKIRVITEAREVYLFGYVSRDQADKATEVARNIIGVKQVVKAFKYGD